MPTRREQNPAAAQSGATADTTFVVGHDIRAWSTFTLKDATQEEIERLQEALDDDLAEFLSALDRADRLEFVKRDTDDAPDPFDPEKYPAVLDVTPKDAPDSAA